ncbi:SpaH/EbpB family LPXTG-anchored major pilin [Actinomyces minihominis]|uniref:SpaH/EbpB family LPXTG-anchored major pilin n=1 Tax=Actinomyces minihominis TaxID=2002838 RepID=UPI000C07D200|nr:SpaH/EbpB family LPXTG-anchored major pilin [Actinomyces minihominis]
MKRPNTKVCKSSAGNHPRMKGKEKEMTKVRKSLTRRALAGVGALALGATGALGLATTAFAAPGSDVPWEHGSPTEGSLTLYKHVSDEGNSNAGNPGGKALKGVTFTATRVGVLSGTDCEPIDLGTEAGWTQWNDLAKEQGGELAGEYCLLDGDNDTVWSDKTDEKGEITWEHLPLGVYYVQETDSGENLIATSAKPFYASVPQSVWIDGDFKGWDYAPVAYPKNELNTPDLPSKTIGKTDDWQVGTDVTWTITAVVPKSDLPYTSIVLNDTPNEQMTFKDWGIIMIGGDELEGPGDDGHYTVNGGKLTFTDAGLKKLNAVTKLADATITAGVTTTVNSNATGGELENKPSIDINGVTGEQPKTNPSTNWGVLKILKYDGKNTETVLKDAEFAVWPKDDDGCGAAAPEGAPRITTGDSGIASKVVWVSDWEADDTTPDSKLYCVQETKAPAGYLIDSTVREVTVKSGDTADKVLNVPNVKPDGPDLPLTGANGTVLLIVGGIALVALAGGAHIVIRNRQRENA